MIPNLAGAMSIYSEAIKYAYESGYDPEIQWYGRVKLESFTETELLRESAWVILCSGFREMVVRSIFDYVSLCFCDWESASAIVAAEPDCKAAARVSFRNEAKLDAISGTARIIQEVGFQRLKSAVIQDPIRELVRLPFIGGITVWHLAKNLGLNVAKPDRHLTRVSSALGFRDAHQLCLAISSATGDEVKVVDLIVWRYLADNPWILSGRVGILTSKNEVL